MTSLRARLPPLTGLVIFEAAARHLSFTRASAELGITQSAVSRQVRALEHELGVRLFTRKHRGIELTHNGERLYRTVAASLGDIARRVDEIHRSARKQDVTVSAWITFSHFWLIPRLHRFRENHLETRLRIVTRVPSAGRLDIEDFDSDGIDVEIRYGSGDWSGVDVTFLFDEAIFPVCSTGYLEGHPYLKSVSDLQAATLLDYDGTDRNLMVWRDWLRNFGVQLSADADELRFGAYANVVQAAIDGQGVALGWKRLVDEPLQKGQLVRFLSEEITPRDGYYVLVPNYREVSPAAATFCDWLRQEAQRLN